MAYAVHLDYGAPRRPDFAWEGRPEGVPLWGLSAGTPFADASRLPAQARQIDAKKLCDVVALPGLNAVSGRFKAIIEEFDPGLHQFFPISLKSKGGEPYDQDYYIFNACRKLDAIIPELSAGMHWLTKKGGPFVGMPYLSSSTDDLVVSRQAIAGVHLWVAHLIVGGTLFFSDALKKRMEREKVRYLYYRHAAESDAALDLEGAITPTRDWLLANKPEWVRENRSEWLQA